MFFITLRCTPEEKDLLIAELWEHGSTGIVESDLPNGSCDLRAFFENGAIVERFGVAAEPADDRNWVEVARERLQPMMVGSRFYLVPEWRDDPTPRGRYRIVINSGLAFGTGAHETTRLCLELLERHARRGMKMIDVGTGSGILSEAALHLGAARAIACDSDESAVEVAARNLAKWGPAAATFVGSAGALRSGIADLITANITPEWVAALAPEFMRLLRDGGCAILSGFEDADVATVTNALNQAGLTVTETRAEAEWRAVVAYRRGIV